MSSDVILLGAKGQKHDQNGTKKIKKALEPLTKSDDDYVSGMTILSDFVKAEYGFLKINSCQSFKETLLDDYMQKSDGTI